MSDKTPPPSRTAAQFIVRLPDGMRDRIAEAAKSNNRSMNAEIVSRLESSFTSPPSGADAWAEVARLEAEHAAAYALLRGANKELEDAVHQLGNATSDAEASSASDRIATLEPMKMAALDEWLALGEALREAKLRAAGISPLGSAYDVVARRVLGEGIHQIVEDVERTRQSRAK